MSKLINLVLLYGGKSGEHEISLRSAASILAKLDKEKYAIAPIGIDKEGCYYQNNYHELLSFPESLPVSTANSRPLANLLLNGRLAVDADVIFPIGHGPLYEDGCLQGMLELAGVAYVGSGVLSSAMGMDKDITRRIACIDGIQSARYRMLSSRHSALEKQRICQQVIAEFGFPLFIKPCSLGSSVGIHKVKNNIELNEAITDALRYDDTILIEEFIQGREIELAVLESASFSMSPRVSTAGEICVNHPDGFYSYTAKYIESTQTELHIPAVLSEDLLTRLQEAAALIFTRLKCKGMARVDFFVNDKDQSIYFNEINTLPGFTSISMYPKLWQYSGIEYSMLLDELISLALHHQHSRQQLVTNYQ